MDFWKSLREPQLVYVALRHCFYFLKYIDLNAWIDVVHIFKTGLTWIAISDPSFTSCVVLSELFNLSEPQFVQLKNGIIIVPTS